MADRRFTATVSGGTATVTISVPNQINRWRVTQLSCEIDPVSGAPIGATGEIRKNGNLVTPFIPTGDPVAGDPPVDLEPTDVLTVKWSGCTNGSVAKVLMFYEVVPR